MKHIGENVVRIEAEALRALADRIAGPMAEAFNRAVELMFDGRGRVVVTGMGKSGIIARKIAATLSSTGTPALFMHPVDAVHGDLGMVVRGDVVLALSASGETEEILRLLATLKRLQVSLISMTGDAVFEKDAGGGARAARSDHPNPPFDHPPLTCYKSWFCIGPPGSNRRPLRYETSDAAKLNTPVQSRVVEACSELRQCAPRRS